MKRQHGVGVIAALVVVIMLAALAAAITSLTTTQSHSAAQDARSAQVWQAARAGNEYGFYHATHGGVCGTNTLNLGTGFVVTVTCTQYTYGEGQTGSPPTYTTNTTRVFRIVSVACPAPAAACPNNAASTTPGYVERTRVIIATN